MAVQGTIETMGGLTATNAYLRISDLTLKKIVEAGNANDGKWQLVYGVYCYVNADAEPTTPKRALLRRAWIGSRSSATMNRAIRWR